MERKLDDVGHRVETEPGRRLISDITHAFPGGGEGGRVGAAAKDRAALQAVLKKAAAVHGQPNEVTRYTRSEPVGVLTAATGVGFLVGLCLVIGWSAIAEGERSAVRTYSRRRFLGRRTGSGWRRLLRLE